MKLFFFLTATFLFLTINSAQSLERVIPGEIIVRLEKQSDVNTLINEFKDLGLIQKRLLSKRMNIWLIEYDVTKSDALTALAKINSSLTVKVAQFNHKLSNREGFTGKAYLINRLIQATIPNDPSFGTQWALNNTGQNGGTPDADIDGPEAWDLATGGVTAQGDTVVVAVVDGGFYIDHEDIHFLKNWDEIPNNNIDDDGDGYIDNFDGWNAYNGNGNITSADHGTHVCGIAGALGDNGIGIAGVNMDVQIMPVQGSSSSESTVVEAYGYILEQRTLYNNTDGAEGAFVVSTNASFGVDYGNPDDYPLWCGIYDDLGAAGILNCGATANLNIDVDEAGDVPTACPSDFMISVTNTTRNDAKNSGAAYGLTTIDLGAPGTDIYSTLPGSSYGSLTGTSMATPQVAGAISLMVAGSNASLIQSYKNNPENGALIYRQYLFESVDVIAALDGITVTGGRLNLYNMLLAVAQEPDNVPPTTITDLQVTDLGSDSYTLVWTAPNDTSRNGVVSYDIRRSSAPINSDADFNNAEQLAYGDPAGAGETETLSFSGLPFNDTKYFAIKSSDIWGNVSEMSNVVMAETYGPPEISVTPDLLDYPAVEVGTVFNDVIQIANTSTNLSTLDYTVSLENNTFPMSVIGAQITANKNQTLNKATDIKGSINSLGGQRMDGAGGPDAGDYVWRDSNDPNGPVYEWNDISLTGTSMNFPNGNQDDGWTNSINLGFTFNYYGTNYSTVRFSSNGLVLFEPLTSSYRTNAEIPNASAPNTFIAPFWDDLTASNQGEYYYQQDGDRFIIQFDDIQKYYSSANGGPSGHYTFQVVLESNGKIKIYYKEMIGATNEATVGIENGDGSIGMQVAYNASYPPSNEFALQFMHEPDWVVANDLGGGRLFNGASANIELSFDATDLSEGDYSMDVVITSNAPDKSVIVVPITMTVYDPVPVELTSFSAKATGNKVELAWETATETNNKGFQIERTFETASGRGEWETIGFVNGQGTTGKPTNYVFEDDIVKRNDDVILYRLKQIDFGGTYSYSDVVEVETVPVKFSLEQNYPNPFNPSTKIEYSLPEKSDVRLAVYNSLGEKVAFLVNETKESGYYSVEWNASELPSGLYIYRIEVSSVNGDNKFVEAKKMLLLK